MNCKNCEREYLDPNQLICEYCGYEISKVKNYEYLIPKSNNNKLLDSDKLKKIFDKIKKKFMQ